jgi:hypothetical protein
VLSNIMLDDLDRELEQRGHRFVRYADLCRARHKSAYAEARVMPTRAWDAVVRAVSGFPLSA